jgi:proteic killer suppression protein
VELEFSLNRLNNAGSSLSEASRIYGVPIGRKYIQRLNILRAVEKFSQLFGFQALRLHPLKGNRTEQYSIMLTGNYRMIVEKIKEDKVRIVDVEDYHGD